jgi:hypothetical protein
LEAELFAESGVGGIGGVLGVDGELEFAPAAADLGALIFQAGVHLGVPGLAGSSRSEAKVGRVEKKFLSTLAREGCSRPDVAHPSMKSCHEG